MAAQGRLAECFRLAAAGVLLPYVARRTVDLAPAVVLAAKLILGALFGFLGLLLADSILATIKVTLQEITRIRSSKEGESP